MLLTTYWPEIHRMPSPSRELYRLYIEGPDDELDESQFSQVLMTAGNRLTQGNLLSDCPIMMWYIIERTNISLIIHLQQEGNNSFCEPFV